MRIYILWGAILTLWIPGLSQKDDKSEKFGRLNPAEFSSKSCPIDSSAHAYYLFDYGHSHFLNTSTELKIVFERHFRIKILDKSAFDEGTFIISLYHQGERKEEELIGLKAVTYNMENGQMIETKLEKSSIFKEKSSEHINKVKYTLPNIKEGSILEVKYEIYSDFLFNFQGWVFQHDLPSLKSEYSTRIPDIISYNPHFWGFVPVDVSYTDSQKPNYNFSERLSLYQAKDIPAFPDEPYVMNKDNFRSRIAFELSSTRFNNITQDYTRTWTSLNELLLNDENFGSQLKKSGYFKDEIEPIKAKNLSLEGKIHAAYNLIKNRMKWNGIESIYTTGNIKKSFDNRSGNVADINLALVSMLRELDLQAYPVVLSTVKNGLILQAFPTLTKFNYVIAAVITADKKILLDAADQFANASILPAKCLNGSGRLINEQEGIWVELKATRLFQSVMNYDVFLDPEKGLVGNYSEKDYHYAGHKLRTELKDSTGTKAYIDKIHEKYKGVKIENVRLSHFNQGDREILLESQLESTLGIESNDDLIYFIPVQMERLLENPFKSPIRQFPVEFEYPWMINAVIEIKIPENFNIESLPKSVAFQNADKSAKFTFLSESKNNTSIKVSSMIFINKARFNPDEYDGLKDFFSHIVSKHAEQIVLRKKV